MKRFILTAVATALTASLGFATNLQAAPHPGGGHATPVSHAPVIAHNHVVTHAANHALVAAHAHAPFVHATRMRYHVRGYRGWAWRCWFPSYSCYGYYGSDDQTWYYWYAPFNEYLPVSYMSTYPPTPVGVAPASVVPTMPGSPVLPGGATFVPGPITTPY